MLARWIDHAKVYALALLVIALGVEAHGSQGRELPTAVLVLLVALAVPLLPFAVQGWRVRKERYGWGFMGYRAFLTQPWWANVSLVLLVALPFLLNARMMDRHAQAVMAGQHTMLAGFLLTVVAFSVFIDLHVHLRA